MAIWDEYGTELTALAVYAVGITVYTLAVALLYVPLSQRMMFAKRFGERQVATPGRRFAYVLLFPLVSFLFFLVISAAILFMGSFTGSLEPFDIMTIAMAIVIAVRVSAYFSERGAEDLAKTMPFGLLGVVLVTNSFSDFEESLANLRALGDEPVLLGLFFGIAVVVEFLLRGIYEMLGRPAKKVMGRKPGEAAVQFQRRP